jgi:hypothetical protein
MVLSIRPMQWANLPELHQTPTLDDSDLDCLEEIRDVLLAPGEILIERPDPDARIREAGRRPPSAGGRTHTVTITEDGFAYARTSYPSLTSRPTAASVDLPLACDRPKANLRKFRGST